MTSNDREQIPLPPRPIESGAQEAIARLQRQCFVELATVQQFHAWLDDKRQCRQACRVIGDSRTAAILNSKIKRNQQFEQVKHQRA